MKVIREALYWLDKNRHGLFYPVGRKLTACVLAYLTGILSAMAFTLLPAVACLLILFLLPAIVFGRKTGRDILLPVCLVFLLAGNCAAGIQLMISDTPTEPNTPIYGTVVRIESDYRVMLDEIALPDGETTKRPVIVTLMNEEEEPLPPLPKVGQRISGTGRLFSQDGIRNPGGVDARLRALCSGYELSGYILPGWSAEGEERFSFSEMFRCIRSVLLERLNLYFGDDAALFAAIMLGEKNEVDAELKNAMRLTGTAHILSVSGMHLTMVSSAVYALLRLLPIGKRIAYAVQIFVMVFFSGLTGFAVGTVRALVMQMLGLLARMTGRRYDPLTALSFAAMAITAFSPLKLLDAGFQFSFFVVFGIHMMMEPIKRLAPMRWLNRKAKWLADMTSVSLSAQLAALPMQLSLYGYAPLLALPMNLFSSILIPFLMIGGWCMIGLGAVFPALAVSGAGIVSLLSNAFEEASLFAASLRGGILRLPSPGRMTLPLVGAAMALIGTSIRFGRWRYRTLLTIVTIIIVLYLPKLNPAMRYVQIDVGQGDASLIRSGRQAVLVDVGPEESYDMIRYLRHEGLSIDTVVLSHLDEDHAGALHALCLSEIGVPRVMISEGAIDNLSSAVVHEGLAILEENGIPIELMEAGDSFSALGMRFNVLAPDALQKGSNERSLLIHVQAKETDLLLTGDLPIKSEPDIVPECDVLKVAHHGSKNASSESFIAQAAPKIAVISVGARNSYGHPHERVLNDLGAIGAQVMRTDENGCITIWLEKDLRTDAYLNPKE